VSGLRSFRDLLVYQSARDVAKQAREYTKTFPSEERFSLANQLRRAADSVALNIAEGYGIGTTQATLRHLRIARGSLCEVRAAIDLATDAGYNQPTPDFLESLDRTARLLHGLIRSLQDKLSDQSNSPSTPPTA
jgi:four helix bundle protein